MTAPEPLTPLSADEARELSAAETVERYGHDHKPDCDCLPIRVVVDQHGHYWRDYGDHWSMCPVSTENVATDPVTEFYATPATSSEAAASPGDPDPCADRIVAAVDATWRMSAASPGDERLDEERLVRILEQLWRAGHATIRDRTDARFVAREIAREYAALAAASPGGEIDPETDALLAGYFDARRSAILNVVAHKASPPEYPGLALVPVSDIERLEQFLDPPRTREGFTAASPGDERLREPVVCEYGLEGCDGTSPHHRAASAGGARLREATMIPALHDALEGLYGVCRHRVPGGDDCIHLTRALRAALAAEETS